MGNVLMFPSPGGVSREPPLAVFQGYIESHQLLDASASLGAMLSLDEEESYRGTLHFYSLFRSAPTRAASLLAGLELAEGFGRARLLREAFGTPIVLSLASGETISR